MKKSITIIFGVMGLMFGLVFATSKIQAAEITTGVYSYYAQKNNNTVVFEVYAPDLINPNESEYINYKEFFTRIETLTGDNNYVMIINFESMYVEYEDGGDVNYWGNADTIIINRIAKDTYIFMFYAYGELKATFTIDYIVPISNNPFIVINTLSESYYDSGYEQGKLDGYLDGYQPGYDYGYLVGLDDSQSQFTDGYNKGKDIGYKNGKVDGEIIGYERGLSDGFEQGEIKGLLDGHKLGVSDVYYDGFGGFINPYTNEPYDVTFSFPYGQGYHAGIESANDYTFTGILFQVFGGLVSLLTIELLPNITIGAIVAVPLVFGIIYFILGKRSGD